MDTIFNELSKKNLSLYELGHKLNFLIQLYNSKRLPKVLMLTGKKGIGKSTLVNHLLNYIYDKENYNLNEFYIPSNKTFKEGNIIFPIDELKNGRHSMILKAYDNQNNSSQAYTEFIIFESPELALNYVLNYPNPFSSSTGFYFEHNQSGNQLKVMIQIYSISGKLVKTINTDISAENKRIGPIQWDGKDDFGDNIGRGVYIYKVKVQLENGKSKEELQKLVLIK